MGRVVGLDNNDRDVIRATVLVSQLDQLFGGCLGTVLLDDLLYFPITNHVCQTIAAENNCVASGKATDKLYVRLNTRVVAQRPRQSPPIGMRLRLFRGDALSLQGLLHPGMVFRDLLDASPRG
jgi:hypothetical protein